MPRDTDKYYQFVYVKNNETIKGASKPFVFEETVGQQQQQQQQQQGYIFYYDSFLLKVLVFANYI